MTRNARATEFDLPPPVDDQLPDEHDGVLSWLADRRRASRLVVTPVDWEDCTGWSVENGRIVHETGGYFGVEGCVCRAGHEGAETVHQPMIAQPEIGILGFLVRQRDGRCEILIHAKTEPGTVRGTQLAPTVQATYSNYTRRHGGAATPYLAYFVSDAGLVHADSLQSEQGWRFTGKFNRNMLVECPQDSAPAADDLHRWCDAEVLLRLIAEDFVVNTDARSVLVSCPWEVLSTDGAPFSARGRTDAFARALMESYRALPEGEAAEAFLAARRADLRPVLERRPLAGLPGYDASSDGLVRGAGQPKRGSEIRLIRASAADREVQEWCQPLLADDSLQHAALLCQHRDGVLRFLFRAHAEPGLANGVELGPTLQSDGGGPLIEGLTSDFVLAGDECAVRTRSRQSDEGGRFDRIVVDYRILEADPDAVVPVEADGIWMTLSDVQALVQKPGIFTNEARSAASLLLQWL